MRKKKFKIPDEDVKWLVEMYNKYGDDIYKSIRSHMSSDFNNKETYVKMDSPKELTNYAYGLTVKYFNDYKKYNKPWAIENDNKETFKHLLHVIYSVCKEKWYKFTIVEGNSEKEI